MWGIARMVAQGKRNLQRWSAENIRNARMGDHALDDKSPLFKHINSGTHTAVRWAKLDTIPRSWE